MGRVDAMLRATTKDTNVAAILTYNDVCRAAYDQVA
jgi:hypothetical protein